MLICIRLTPLAALLREGEPFPSKPAAVIRHVVSLPKSHRRRRAIRDSTENRPPTKNKVFRPVDYFVLREFS